LIRLRRVPRILRGTADSVREAMYLVAEEWPSALEIVRLSISVL
jgi:hypothetical protein